MRSRRAMSACFSALCAASMLAAPSSRADDRSAPAAEALFREGLRLYASDHVHEACEKFAESYRLDPANGTLQNLAACHEKEGRTATAWAEWSALATRAQASAQQSRAELAREHVAALGQSLARIELRVPPTTNVTELTVDEMAVGKAAWSVPLPVDPGEHDVTFRGPSGALATKHVAVAAGATLAVDVPVFAAPAVGAARPAGSTPERHGSAPPEHASARRSARDVTLGAVALGLGAVALGTGTYFGVRTFAKKNEAAEHCSSRFCDDDGLALDRQAHSSALISTIAFSIAGAGLAAGAWFFFGASKMSAQIAAGPDGRSGALRLSRAW